MHTLYGARGSGSAAVEAALVLADLRWTEVQGATWEPGAGYEALQRVNPLAQVPTLVLPDGTVLSESAAILIHLGLAHPASGLLPQETAARARALRGLLYIAANCYAAIGVIDYPERWLPHGTRKPARERLRLGARTRLHRLWDGFADSFVVGDEPFLGGAGPGALDLLAAVVSKWSGARAHLKDSRPDFAAVLGRIDTHPRIAPVFARHWP